MDLKSAIYRNLVYPGVIGLRGAWMYERFRELQLSQYWSGEQLQELQLSRLNALLDYARNNVEFYRERIPGRISSMGELTDIPVLTKEDLRASYSSLRSTRSGGIVTNKTTGGSTGAPVTVAKSGAGIASELASMWRGYSWANIHIGDRQARFWGIPQERLAALRARLTDLATNRVRLSAFAFEDADLSSFTRRLSRFKPRYFYGYVSAIRAYADFFLRDGMRPPIRPMAIITTSEVLTKSDREALTSVFGCRVYDEYGCGEVGSIAHECECGSLHISIEDIVVEMVDSDGNPVPNGEPGDVLVTNLSNYTMPLIRYRLGDRATLASEPCLCGRGLPVIAAVHGREYDILQNWKGQKFHGEFFLYIVEDARKRGLPISGYQVEQIAERELLIRVICEDLLFEKVTSHIAGRIRRDFDSECRITFERVQRIPREPSGKLRVVKRLGPGGTGPTTHDADKGPPRTGAQQP